MEQDFTYDLEPWYAKRKTLWRAMQIPGEGVGMVDAWRDHAELYRLLKNADQYAFQIVKEEVNCRRLRKFTAEHKRLITKFEETAEMLETMTVMYRLSHPG